MIKTYITILVSLIVFDSIWLNLTVDTFYQKYLGHLGGIFFEKFTIWPAATFYIMYAFGVMYFVVNPALEAKSLSLALVRGAFLGLLAYGTYDLTNQATIAKWPIMITFVDVGWGVLATSLVSVIAYTVISRL